MPNREPEVGFQTVTIRAPDDPLVPGAQPPTILQWHGDTFDLPGGSVPLALSTTCGNQAFRRGSAAYGLQFHLETTREQIAEWGTIPAYRQALDRVYGTDGPARLLRDAMHLQQVHAVARRIFTNFARIVESAGRSGRSD